MGRTMDCKECEKLMDDYCDRHLSRKKKKQIPEHLKICKECATKFREYKKMLVSIQNIGMKKCPDEVVDSVFDILSIDGKSLRRKSILDRINEFLFLYSRQLGITGAAVMVFFFVILIHSKINKPPQVKRQYSTHEVRQATDQVKLALAYLNQVTSRTEEIIEKQILHQQVIKPMKSSIKTALKGVGLNNDEI